MDDTTPYSSFRHRQSRLTWPIQVALMYVIVVNLTMCGNWGVYTLTLERDLDPPSDEYAEVFEGDVLVVNCNVSHYNDIDLPTMSCRQDYVQWSYRRDPTDSITYLTPKIRDHNNIIYTEDGRVSVLKGVEVNNYYTFSLQVTNITISDAGQYTCNATWEQADKTCPDKSGNVTVSVKHFPKENPVCSTNITDTDGAYVRCDTMQGYPDVDIVWTSDQSSKTFIGNLSNYTKMGRQYIRSELLLNTEQQFIDPVCTVTSSAFPGMNRTCSESFFTSIASSSDPIGISVKPDGLPIPIVPIVVVPIILIFIFVSITVFCIIKQKRKHKEQADWNNTPRKTEWSGGIRDPNVVPCSVTTQEPDTRNISNETGDEFGRRTHTSLYEVELNFAGEVVKSSEISKLDQEGSTEAEFADGISPYYKTVHPEDDHRDSIAHRSSETNCQYEVVKGAVCDGEVRTGTSGASLGKRVDVPATVSPKLLQVDVHYEDVNGAAFDKGDVISHFTNEHNMPTKDPKSCLVIDESTEGMIDNPFYEPFA